MSFGWNNHTLLLLGDIGRDFVFLLDKDWLFRCDYGHGRIYDRLLRYFETAFWFLIRRREYQLLLATSRVKFIGVLR